MTYFPLRPEDRTVVDRWLSAGGSPAVEDVSAVVGYSLWSPVLVSLCRSVARRLPTDAWESSLVGRSSPDESAVLRRFFSEVLEAAVDVRQCDGRVRGVVRDVAALWHAGTTAQGVWIDACGDAAFVCGPFPVTSFDYKIASAAWASTYVALHNSFWAADAFVAGIAEVAFSAPELSRLLTGILDGA